MAHGPLSQFAPYEICGIFTNAALSACIAMCCVLLLCVMPLKIIPGYIQLSLEFVHNFIANELGAHQQKYIPLMTTVFWYICISNLLGMIPGIFPTTSHFLANLALSLPIFMVLIYEGFIRNIRTYIRHFFIPGVPIVISPFVAIIELFTFCLRPITLAFRLCVTITVGHLLLHIFADIAVSLGSIGFLGLIIIVPVTIMEIFIGILQAGIFTMLCCMYLSEIH